MLLAYESIELSDFGLVRDLLRQTRSFATEPATTNAARSVPAWEWRHLLYESRDEASLVITQRVGSVNCLVVSPDDHWLAAGDSAGQISLWRLPALDPSAQWHLAKDVQCLAFAPSSDQLAVGCLDGTVFVLAVPSGKEIAEFRERNRILGLRFSAPVVVGVYG